MDPFERLRYVARRGPSGPVAAAAEAAPAFARLAAEPGALLTAARRLLDFHPTSGPLWWMCARVLAADDAEMTARFAVAELEEDPTPRHAQLLVTARAPAVVVALAAPGDHVVGALGGALPPSVRMVGDGWEVRRAIAALAEAADDKEGPIDEAPGDEQAHTMSAPPPNITGWSPSEAAAALDGADLMLVDVLAAGPSGVLTPAGGAALVRAAVERGVPVWALAGTGRVLPAPLFDLVLGRGGADTGDLVPVQDLTSVIGPAGAASPAASLASSDCPVPVELLRQAR